jgi:signal transduction histidine kinase
MSKGATLLAETDKVQPSIGRWAAQHEGGIRPETIAGLGRFADGEAHDLANLLVGIRFCLEQLRGHQRTAELEEITEKALQGAVQSVESTSALLLATRALARIVTGEPASLTRPA